MFKLRKQFNLVKFSKLGRSTFKSNMITISVMKEIIFYVTTFYALLIKDKKTFTQFEFLLENFSITLYGSIDMSWSFIIHRSQEIFRSKKSKSYLLRDLIKTVDVKGILSRAGGLTKTGILKTIGYHNINLECPTIYVPLLNEEYVIYTGDTSKVVDNIQVHT